MNNSKKKKNAHKYKQKISITPQTTPEETILQEYCLNE